MPGNPPTRGATISQPANGAVFSSTPISVSGICPAGLLIKIFDNGVFVGSAVCSSSGSYSLQIDLFSGSNQLVARDFDALDQAGPDSPTTTVTFNDAQFKQFGSQLTLSSIYAERGAAPGSELDWPIIINGGNGPYAVSVDWGDGSSSLISQSYPGGVTISHTYSHAGLYSVIVKASDKNGQQAFLQIVGQATGALQSNTSSPSKPGSIIEKDIIWWPNLISLPLLLIAFWLGRRYQLNAFRKHLR